MEERGPGLAPALLQQIPHIAPCDLQFAGCALKDARVMLSKHCALLDVSSFFTFFTVLAVKCRSGCLLLAQQAGCHTLIKPGILNSPCSR